MREVKQGVMVLFKRKFLCATLITLSTNFAYGNMKEDVAFLNELYKTGKIRYGSI